MSESIKKDRIQQGANTVCEADTGILDLEGNQLIWLTCAGSL